MAKQDVIKHFRTSTADRVPLAAELEDGELFINIEDGLVYFKKTDDTIVRLGETKTETFTVSVAGTTTWSIPASAKVVLSLFINQLEYSENVTLDPPGSGQVVYDDDSSYSTEVGDFVKIIYI